MKTKKLSLDNALLSILAVGYSKCLELDLAEGMLNRLDDSSPKYIYPFNYLLAACEIQVFNLDMSYQLSIQKLWHNFFM